MKMAQADSPHSVAATKQAIDAFARFSNGSELTFADFTEELLGEWVSQMLFEGYSLKTATQYLKKLATLYNKCALQLSLPPCEGFTKLQTRMKASAESQRIVPDVKAFEKLRALQQLDAAVPTARRMARDMVLLSVYAGGLTYDDLATLRKEALAQTDRQIAEIVSRYAKPRNSYLFPLEQGRMGRGRINRRIETMFYDALASVGLSLSADSQFTAMHLWSAVAFRCGIPASQILAAVGPDNATGSFFELATPAVMNPEMRSKLHTTVSEALACNPRHWYAMQFRPRVKMADVAQIMDERGFGQIETFYPMEEIVRKVGHKRISQARPVIDRVMFFRCRVTDIPTLFAAIGNHAWCYRTTRNPLSPYAVIPPTQIALYQRTIGQFTPVTDLHPAGTLRLRPGDRVEVIGGDFAGYSATVAHAITRPAPASATDPAMPGRTIYRLRLLGATGIEWTVDTDPRLLRPIATRNI